MTGAEPIQPADAPVLSDNVGAARMLGLSVPEACRAGLVENMALLATHIGVVRAALADIA